MKRLLAMVLLFSTTVAIAQEHKLDHTEEADHTEQKGHGKNFILFEYGYTHISEAVPHDGHMVEEGHWVSSFGIDYFRLLNEKWSAGIKLDYEFGHYIIPEQGDLKRENVFLVIPTAAYSIVPRWVVYAGPGIEFEEEKNLFVVRVGTDYAFHLGHGWELPIGFFLDCKEGYDTYAFTAGIGKVF